MFTSRVAWETLRSIDTAAWIVPGTYQALGGPLTHPSYILKLVNNSTALVTISIDGTTDIDIAPAGSFWLYDEGKVGQSASLPALQSGTQIYVKGSAGTGSVYLVSQYIIQS